MLSSVGRCSSLGEFDVVRDVPTDEIYPGKAMLGNALGLIVICGLGLPKGGDGSGG
ncbi:MAG: hypothetical protein Ct9H300mP19_00950 [Dehalococcoidia bacterium]|nr:MAG: hypothetical protein Ct9H300mP19_00950 [Dehalococcoidia bacterium]